jgi:hypothetical protein
LGGFSGNQWRKRKPEQPIRDKNPLAEHDGQVESSAGMVDAAGPVVTLRTMRPECPELTVLPSLS